MKTLLKPFIALMLISCLHSCAVDGPKAVSTGKPDNNPDYNVSFLFEYDGCKVYRFLDHGYFVYFTNCTGEATAIKADSTETRITNTTINSTSK